MPPTLLYHSSNPTLYPTKSASVNSNTPGPSAGASARASANAISDDYESLLVVRFSGPVRVSSVRIIPEGVGCFGGVGTTYPPSFPAEILLNISPSQPVNALARIAIQVVPAEHALDYAIGMPVGVTTRMMMFRSLAQKLTISIYGDAEASTTSTDVDPALAAGMLPTANDTHPAVLTDDSRTSAVLSSVDVKPGTDDRSWIHSWAGPNPDSLFDLLDSAVPSQISDRAMECIFTLYELTLQTNSPNPQPHTILDDLLNHPTALAFALSRPDTPLANSILSQPRYSLHPAVSPFLPSDHPLKPLVSADSSKRHEAAWRHLHLGVGPLIVLVAGGKVEDELLQVQRGQTKSNLVRLVDLAEACTNGGRKEDAREVLGLTLDILDCPLSDEIALRYLARRLPRLVVFDEVYRRGSDDTRQAARKLAIPLDYARDVLHSLIEMDGEVIAGSPAWPAAKALARQYTSELREDDPLRRLFEDSTPAPTWPSIPTINSPQLTGPVKDAASIRRLERLARVLDAHASSKPPSQIGSSASPATPTSVPSSLIHSCTPAELISLISPGLYAQLSTASSPMFGIPPTSQSTDQGAKSFAGKVYTSHEFRRGLDGGNISPAVGLGISSPGGVQPGMGVGVGVGVGAGMPLGVSRPASRHVDSYTGAR